MKKFLLLIIACFVLYFLFVKKSKTGSAATAPGNTSKPTTGTPEQTATKPYERMLPPDPAFYPKTDEIYRFDEQNPDDIEKIKEQNATQVIEQSRVVTFVSQQDEAPARSSFKRKIK